MIDANVLKTIAKMRKNAKKMKIPMNMNMKLILKVTVIEDNI